MFARSRQTTADELLVEPETARGHRRSGVLNLARTGIGLGVEGPAQLLVRTLEDLDVLTDRSLPEA